MYAVTVFEHLKEHGQLLDPEIAAATGGVLDDVRVSRTVLSAQGDIFRCSVTSDVNGESIEVFERRLAGCFQCPAPGRKPGANVG